MAIGRAVVPALRVCASFVVVVEQLRGDAAVVVLEVEIVIELHVRKSALFDESPDFVAGVGSDSPYAGDFFGIMEIAFSLGFAHFCFLVVG